MAMFSNNYPPSTSMSTTGGSWPCANCPRQAWNNSNVRDGTCEFLPNGLGSFGEPQMILRRP
jgi:hypothetical protein